MRVCARACVRVCVSVCVCVGPWTTLTWCEQAVEVSDDGREGGPVRGLVVHAAVDEVGQLGPLGRGQLVLVLVEQALLQHRAGTPK